MKKNEQSGRSMVEMLGVLAIIGVLSIGGIMGYTMAMSRYRTTVLMNSINQYAAIVFTTYNTKVVAQGETWNAEKDIPKFTDVGFNESIISPYAIIQNIEIPTTTPKEPAKQVNIRLKFSDAKIGHMAAQMAQTICSVDSKGNCSFVFSYHSN